MDVVTVFMHVNHSTSCFLPHPICEKLVLVWITHKHPPLYLKITKQEHFPFCTEIQFYFGAEMGHGHSTRYLADIEMLLATVVVVPCIPSVAVPVVISVCCLDLHNNELWCCRRYNHVAEVIPRLSFSRF